jgi:hypothetical protein
MFIQMGLATGSSVFTYGSTQLRTSIPTPFSGIASKLFSLWTVCLSGFFPTMRKEECHILEPARWASSPQYGTQTIGLLKVAA